MSNPTHESVVKFFGHNDVDDFKVTLTISKKSGDALTCENVMPAYFIKKLIALIKAGSNDGIVALNLMRYTCKESREEEDLLRDYVKVVRDISKNTVKAIARGTDPDTNFSTKALSKPELIKPLINLIWNNPKRTDSRDIATGKHSVKRNYTNERIADILDKLLLEETEYDLWQQLNKTK